MIAEPTTTQGDRRGERFLGSPRFHLVFLVAVISISYLRAVFLPFIWDDHKIIETNPLVQRADGVLSVFEADFFSHAEKQGLSSEYFRPLTVLSFWLDARVGSAAVHHLANVLLHLWVVLLFRRVLTRFGVSEPGATAAALFFGLNPIQTETVYWISARSGLLDGLFTLLAVLTAISSGSAVRRFFFTGIFCLLAVLSKETGLLSVLAVTALTLAFRGTSEIRHWLIPAALGGAAAVIIYLVLRYSLGVFVPSSSTALSFAFVDLATAASMLLRWMVVPFNLSAAWDFEPISTSSTSVVYAVLGFLLCLSIVLWRRGLRIPLAALVVFLGYAALIGYSSRNIGVISERFAYLPTLFFTLFVVDLAKGVRFVRSSADTMAAVSKAAVIAMILVFAPVVWLRSHDWQAEKRLFASAIEVSRSTEAMRILGIHLAKNDDCAGALSLFARRVKKRPSDAQAWNNAAACSINLRRYSESLRFSQNALRLDPSRPQSWLNLATSLIMIGRPKEALSLLDRYAVWKNDSPLGMQRLPKNDRYYRVRQLATQTLRATDCHRPD